MPQTRTARAPVRAARAPSRTVRASQSRVSRVRSIVQFLRRLALVFLAFPLGRRIIVSTVAMLAVWSAVDWACQLMRKPSELFLAVSGALHKLPAETGRS